MSTSVSNAAMNVGVYVCVESWLSPEEGLPGQGESVGGLFYCSHGGCTVSSPASAPPFLRLLANLLFPVLLIIGMPVGGKCICCGFDLFLPNDW